MDFVYIGALVAFFVLVAGMAAGCDKLGGQQWTSFTSSVPSPRPACWSICWWRCWKRRTC